MDEIVDLTESVSEGFPTYSYILYNGGETTRSRGETTSSILWAKRPGAKRLGGMVWGAKRLVTVHISNILQHIGSKSSGA